MLSPLTAEFMGIPMNKVCLYTRNTDQTTVTGPAAGNRYARNRRQHFRRAYGCR